MDGIQEFHADRQHLLAGKVRDALAAVLPGLIRGQRQVLLYPAGALSRALVETGALTGVRLLGFGDSDPGRHPPEIAGLPVYGADRLKALDPDAVLVCSLTYHDEIMDALGPILDFGPAELIDLAAHQEYLDDPEAPQGYLAGFASEIEADCAYAVKVAAQYRDQYAAQGQSLAGKSVLELGPGRNLGAALTLKAMGAAQVTVADPGLVGWDDAYHPLYYQRLLEMLAARADTRLGPPGTGVNLRAWVEAQIRCLRVGVEQLASIIAGGSVDLSVSFAVLEHLSDHGEGFRQLHAVTKPGGFGLHDVDFRCHFDFNDPLQYLLWDDRRFATWHTLTRGNRGHRMRPWQMEPLIKAAGFSIVDRHVYDRPAASYMAKFMPLLRRARRSAYHACSADQLSEIGISYGWVKSRR